MDILLIALLGLFGSSTVAALLSTRWQQTKYRLEKHSSAEKLIIEEHSRLRAELMSCYGLLVVQKTLGQIRSNQKVTFDLHLNNISSALRGLDEGRLRMTALAPELGANLEALQSTAAKTAALLESVMFDTRGGSVVVTTPGKDLSVVISDMFDGLKAMGIEIASTVEQIARNQDRVVRSALSWRPAIVFFVVLISSAVLYFRVGGWTPNLSEQGVVWTNNVTREMRIVPFDQYDNSSSQDSLVVKTRDTAKPADSTATKGGATVRPSS